MKDQSFFPHVIAFENKPKKEVKLPIPQVVQAIHQISIKGLVSKEGKFLIDPGGMVIDHTSPGVYKIIHNLGYTNTALNVSIMEAPGGATIKEHHPTYFVVEVQEDAQPKDKDWCFTLMRTI